MKTMRSRSGSPFVVSTLQRCSAIALVVMPVVPDAAKVLPRSCQTPMDLVALSGTWQAEALAQVPGGGWGAASSSFACRSALMVA